MSDDVNKWLRGVASYADVVKNKGAEEMDIPNTKNVGKFDALKVRISGTENFGYLLFKEDENGLYPEFLTKEEYEKENA